MNPQNLSLVITFAGGFCTGAAVASIVTAWAASKIQTKRLIRKERESWSAAAAYLEHKSREAA